ncbi:MAG: glycosyltransferase family 2 protein [Planctomycetota bacterium]|jgi:glycosyltransferase involved in cell wall biosynthesis
MPDDPTADRPDVSIVVPMLNEVENVEPLWRELVSVMDDGPLTWEAIFVDDGSLDDTVARLRAAVGGDPRVTIIELARRFGQSAAMAAGFEQARGRAVVPMDADQQNDPRDIAALVRKLDEPPGWDIVSGWRRQRQDRLLSRRLPSMIANRIIGRVTWTPLHDFGCSLKAYRREMLSDVRLYGEMHRFLPAICNWRGARITEMVVNHRPRTQGRSKYGLRRTFKVLLDLITVKFLGDYLAKPIYFFGKLSVVTLTMSLLSLGIAIAQKYGFLWPGEGHLNLNRNVLVMFAMMLFLMTVMFVMIGVIAELLVRIYLESTGRSAYRIRQVTNGEPAAGAAATPLAAAETAPEAPAPPGAPPPTVAAPASRAG